MTRRYCALSDPPTPVHPYSSIVWRQVLSFRFGIIGCMVSLGTWPPHVLGADGTTEVAVTEQRQATSKTHFSVVMVNTERSLVLMLAGRSRPVCIARTIVVLIVVHAEIARGPMLGETKDS